MLYLPWVIGYCSAMDTNVFLIPVICNSLISLGVCFFATCWVKLILYFKILSSTLLTAGKMEKSRKKLGSVFDSFIMSSVFCCLSHKFLFNSAVLVLFLTFIVQPLFLYRSVPIKLG